MLEGIYKHWIHLGILMNVPVMRNTMHTSFLRLELKWR
jgi:hypothetical protein